MKTSIILIVASVAAAAVALVATGVAAAKAGDVTAAGTCSGASTSKIKLGPRSGSIEVQFEVDQNLDGVTWNVTLEQNGSQVFSGTAKTKAPSGSFEVKKVLADTPRSSHTIIGTAVNPATGEVCSATATV